MVKKKSKLKVVAVGTLLTLFLLSMTGNAAVSGYARWLPNFGANGTLCTGTHTGRNFAKISMTRGSKAFYTIAADMWVLKSGKVITDYMALSIDDEVIATYNSGTVAQNTYLVGRGDCPVSSLYVEGEIDF